MLNKADLHARKSADIRHVTWTFLTNMAFQILAMELLQLSSLALCEALRPEILHFELSACLFSSRTSST